MAKEGGTLVCVPCGREVLVTESGTSYSELWCCGIAMEPKAKKAPARKAVAAKPAKKAAPKKAVKKAAKKAAKKSAPRKKSVAGKSGGRK